MLRENTGEGERTTYCFNGHPPLGVNATDDDASRFSRGAHRFQWAPTLGGECYVKRTAREFFKIAQVSMGTHPWG